MNDVWDADADNVNAIKVGDAEETREGELDAETVRDVARENGVKKFNLEDAETGESLNPEDFPYDGDVNVREYNENA